MNARGARSSWIVAAVLFLHLAAHFAPWTGREVLPEDAPAFTANSALASPVRAALDPASAWEGGADCVGRARWRPVAQAVLAVERAAPWATSQESAAAGAALVSLALHVLVALGAARLARTLSGDDRAALAAGLLAAASPAALSAAAWPARQAVVLATALAVGGALMALRGGAKRLFVAGGLLSLAGLAHEAAFGWSLAAPLLVHAATRGATRRRDAWPCLALPAAAFAARAAVLGGFGATAPGASALGGAFADGAAGVVAAVVSFCLPARTHFADGPFAFGTAGRVVGVAALLVGVVVLARRPASRPAAGAALAALAALTPVLFAPSAGVAPYQDAYLYVALPLLTAAAGMFFADRVARRGPARTAAVAAAAMLLGASVAATAVRAAAYRTRTGLVLLALDEEPESPVVRAWDAWRRLPGGPAALAGDVRRLATDVAASSPPLVGDAVGAATVSKFFVDYAGAVAGSNLPRTAPAWDAAESGASAALQLRPRSARFHAAVADFRLRAGLLRESREAVQRARALAEDEIDVAREVAEVALAIGFATFAADEAERALELWRDQHGAERPDDELFLLYARATAADGAARVPDPSSDQGIRYRYDLAAEALEDLRRRSDARPGGDDDLRTRRLLYDVYVRYGDLLVAADRPAMALIAYDRAVGLQGGDETSNAGTHRKWLADRLAKDEADASESVRAAFAEPGAPNVANALVKLYAAFCRQKNWRDADELFAKLEKDLGGVSARLRLQRAIHRYAALEDEEDQRRAETELRAVLKEEPGLARARYELARVLEWLGTNKKLDEAAREYERAALDGRFEDWSLDAAQRAKDLLRPDRR